MISSSNIEIIQLDTPLIIGAGLSALVIALRYEEKPIALLTDQPVGTSGSTLWAQGGIAAALGPKDTPSQHAQDTLRMGLSLSKEESVHQLTHNAQEAIQFLADLGVCFDRDEDNHFFLGLEGGHSHRRIVKSRNEHIGVTLMHSIVRVVRSRPNIRLFESYTAFELYCPEGTVCGMYAFSSQDPSKIALFLSPVVVLCTGGIGYLYSQTTNPAQARGDGLAMALQVGSVVENMEFVQFHPTALACDSDPLPLLTEALRGEGALLVNERGERFMCQVSPLAELSGRDIVAQAVARQKRDGHTVYLDARPIHSFARKFAATQRMCQKWGYNPPFDLLPVTPAAHYHMGGIRVDNVGQSSTPGLRACGEVASTGVHGANRLASNSLLESLVYGTFLARDLMSLNLQAPPVPIHAPPPKLKPSFSNGATQQHIRHIMQTHVGVLRHRSGLSHALEEFKKIQTSTPACYPLSHMLRVCQSITQQALARQESLGSHFREDSLAQGEGGNV